MKRRKAMHYLRKMIDNPAIAYMLTYNEPNTDLRRNAVRMYYKYRRFMKADSLMIPILDPDDRSAKENTFNAIIFDRLTTKKPVVMKCYDMMYPSSIHTAVDKVNAYREAAVSVSFAPQGISSDLDEEDSCVSKIISEWINGIVWDYYDHPDLDTTRPKT